MSPSAVSIDSAGNVYAADSESIRVQKFDANGNFLFSLSAWGVSRVGGVAATNTRIYVSDIQGHKIQVYGQETGGEQPSLLYELSGNTLMLSWSSTVAGFAVEMTDDLGSGQWDLAPGGDVNPANVPVEGTARFYRLAKP
jgi:outer membrane protein assembly factor BamB